MPRAEQQLVRLKDYQPPPYLVDKVELRFEIGDELTEVHSRLGIYRNPESTGKQTRLSLDGEALTLKSVILDGRSLEAGEYEQDETSLHLPVKKDAFDLEIITGIEPGKNTSLEGLYESGGNLFTMCEPEGFRKITYFPDRPDVMSRFTTTVVADRDRYPVLLSNGNLIDRGKLEADRHWATWRDPFPKPSYLFALVAGELVFSRDTFTTMSGRKVDVRLYVQKQNADKCAHALRSIKKAMKWDEEVFGREYDLDVFMVVAVDDFNAGAMENKGLNIFNSKYVLARPETATDEDYENITSVIAHEYFHNWSGNRVTLRDWFQLSLKEGFTVFRDQLFTSDMTSKTVKRISDVNLLRTGQFKEEKGPLAHPVRPGSYVKINNFYTQTVYNKGAEVVRMLYTILGEDGFRKGSDLYFERYDGLAATVEDFIGAMADANDADLDQFMRWYDQAGTPVIEVKRNHDADSKTYTLELVQSCPSTPGQETKEPFHIPFAVGLLDREGRELPLRLEGEDGARQGHTKVLELKRDREKFVFEGIAEKPVLSALRGFSAPVKLDMEYTDSELALMMKKDGDEFNRWDAGQRLATRIILGLLDSNRGDVHAGTGEFKKAFRENLNDRAMDRRLKAQIIMLTSEQFLAEQLETIDPEAIHVARRKILVEIAREMKDDFLATYHRNLTPGEYSIDGESIGKRRLKNLCLAYVMETGDRDAVELCLEQLEKADNMTDTIASLTCLANSDWPERAAALDDFYERWKEDPLVIDKWFSIQAGSRQAGTLDKVEALMGHPAFNIENPNRVRALVGTFSAANQVRFHDSTGKGYEFLADRVLEIDPMNSHIAARLLTPLSQWRRYEPRRREKMKAQLERVIEASGLSSNSHEIVARSLGFDPGGGKT